MGARRPPDSASCTRECCGMLLLLGRGIEHPDVCRYCDNFVPDLLEYWEEKRRAVSALKCANHDCTALGKHKCSKSGMAYYCSAQCQRTHWKAAHKEECKWLAAPHCSPLLQPAV